MLKRAFTCSAAVVLLLGSLIAFAADENRDRPAAQAQAPAARGHGLVPDRPKADPSAGKRLTKPDSYVWPAASLVESQTDVGAPRDQGRRVRVRMLDRGASRRAGVSGPLMQVQDRGGPLRLSYAAFEHAYGGDWGARLRFVQLPACALATPERPECRTATPVASRNDTEARTLSTTAVAGTVLAMDATDASAQGDYKATKLAPSSSWSTALASGGFLWSHPIRVPQIPAGPAPQVTLSYASQSVDGHTSATNNQGSWVGEGMTYEPGFIERRYQSCADDGHAGSAEHCWAFQNATMMMSGHSGALVRAVDGTWRLSNDDGSRIEQLTGPANGDNDGEYWKLTTTDGTQMFFGLNRLPGYTAGKEETESVWSAPVYGDDPGEPCNNASGFTDSYCDQAWRWNLDYVVDPRGNVMSFFYDREINYYARGGNTGIDGTPYVRAGYLAHIDYGQRDGQVYTANAPARVIFTTDERCLKDAGGICTSYPDVPEDLVCAPGTHCTSTQASVTFFTRKRLSRIETQIQSGGSWSPVESWSLEHVWLANDDGSRTLWPKKIIHSGHAGGSTISLPAVELDGIQLPNRVDSATDGIGPLVRYRLASVKSESGAQTTINYKPVNCFAGATPTPESNPKRCFPVRWNPFGGAESNEVIDWFHKYVVDTVVDDDLVGGNPDMVTSYEYVGDAAWRKNEPDGITKDRYLTWADWRGYNQVIARTGNGQTMPTRTDHFFLRGLGGSVADSTGSSHSDVNGLAGQEFETVVYNGPDIVSKAITVSTRQVTQTHSGPWGTREAAFVRTSTTRDLTAQPGGSWQETRLNNSYDTVFGRQTQIEDLGDLDRADDDTCTRTWYADNAARYMYAYVSRTQTVSVKCDVTANLATQLIQDDRTSYDLQAWSVAPFEGTATRSEALDRFDGTNILHVTTSETTEVDDYGRPRKAKDALGGTTITDYTETAGLTTQVRVTNPLGHVTTTVNDPSYALPSYMLDPNNKRTDFTYDPLGRLTAVWLPDRSKALGASPNTKFGYNVRNDKTSVIITEKINNDGSYQPSYELLDGLLRTRQEQVPGPNGWLLQDSHYLGTGQIGKTNATYLATGAPGDSPIVVAEGSVNGQTTIAYDGAGRKITETFSVAGSPMWTTTTTYEGNKTHVDPPAGGVPTTSVVDARGRQIELRQYLGSSPSGSADVTSFTYTPAGSLATMTDPLGNQWRYSYNQRNRRVLSEDPDAGDTTYTHDAAGNVTSVTDSRGVKVSYKYDLLGRRIETWQGDIGTGVKLTASKYDTKALGRLYYTARYTSAGTYFVSYESLDARYRALTTRFWVPSASVGTELGKNYDFTTAYNPDGTIQSIGLPAAGGLPAESVVTSYDSLRRPTALTGNTTYVTGAAYSNTGQLLQAELHTGGLAKKAWLSWDFERGTDRLSKTRVNRQDVPNADMDASYKYDAAGNVVSIADTPAGGQRDIQCFGYDYLRRLTEAWSTSNTNANPCAGGAGATGVSGPAPYHQSWDFDKAGNRRTETVHGLGVADTVRTYAYPVAGQGQNQPHTTTSVTETGPGGSKTFQYGYDSRGNTTCRPNGTAGNTCTSGNQELTWDAEGHLATSTPQGGPTTSYLYDAGGNRMVRIKPGVTTLYLAGMELRLDTTSRSVTGTRFYSFGATKVAVRSPAGTQFQMADHHGTVVCTIDAGSGAIAWRRSTPYGGVRGSTPPWPDEKAFVGGTLDATTGLTHLGAREYDQSTGRFVSEDAITDTVDPQQWHGYSYASGSPLNLSDESGLLAAASDDDEIDLIREQKRRQQRAWLGRQVNLRHDAAVEAAAARIRIMVAARGGSPQCVVTEYRIEGASKKPGSNEDGYADIVYLEGNVIYVWEVKSWGVGDATAGAEVQHYMRHIEATAKMEARPGFPIVLPVAAKVDPASDEFVFAYDGGSPGSILYITFRLPKPKPAAEPVTEPAPAKQPDAVPAGCVPYDVPLSMGGGCPTGYYQPGPFFDPRVPERAPERAPGGIRVPAPRLVCITPLFCL